ncbi:TonB-dependent receptor [Sphingobacterium sp. SGG-5]|uniref:TonB-dependent receptor n=1 Tax=Sphingobacterium sp. SGG-5 TaxID=2710881 RepID=UPI0013ECC427|nr:TonB-dependent receptor [Sphingobacterium sp. SGG-5]NGM63308.1 TonB-dependent receptor [Sphingobacterium sp. SGG-5]
MKIIIALLLIGAMHLSAASLSQTITLDVKNVAIKQVFDEIHQQTNFGVIYNDQLVDSHKKVTIAAKQMPLDLFLQKVLTAHNMSYKIKEKTIFVRSTVSTSAIPRPSESLQQIKVRGKVVDDNGDPLIGATVNVKGTAIQTKTDAKGEYSISASNAQSVLVFSFLGYGTIENVVGNQQTIDIKLSPSNQDLEQVVVVGYGTTLRKDLTGAVGTVNMQDIMEAPVGSIDEALAGRIAGVQVSADEGQPGSAMKIVIRGQNSVTQGNEPLFVVDGFPMDDFEASGIAPEDIESMTILKDASATAIYGARGANGVIVIETKKGMISAPKITYSGYLGVQNILKKIEVMSPYEFVRYQIERNPAQAALSYLTNGKTLESYRNTRGYDWQDRLFRRGSTMNHNISVRGGNASTKYAFSTSLYNQDGIMIASAFDRIQGRLSLEQALNKKIRASLNVSYSDGIVNGPSPSANAGQSTSYLMYSAWGYRPVTGSNIDLEDDLFDEELYDPEEEELTFDNRVNPVLSTANELVTRRTRLFSPNLNLTYDINKYFTLNIRGGATLRNYINETFYNSLTRRGAPRVNNVNGVNGSITHSERSSWVNENTLTYKKTFKRYHKMSLLGGFTMQAYNYNRFGYSAKLLPNEVLGMSGLEEGTLNTGYADISDYALASFLTRAEYDYRSKYLFTASFRADGSSKFSPGNRWSYFPSGAFAWRMSKERFMKNLKFIHDAKLRVSYGVTGNNRVSDFSYMSTLAMPVAAAYSFGGTTPIKSMVPSKLGNDILQWENTSQFNLGYDLSLLKGKIKLEVDAYRKTTYDLLLNANIPYTTGFATAYKNIGKVQNQGLEFTLNTTNIRNKDFQWTSSFNISFNNNKVLALAESEDNMLTPMAWDSGYNGVPLYITEIGRPISMFYGYIWDGVYTLNDFDEIGGNYVLKANVPDNGAARTSIRPGNIKFKDINGDGVIDSKDATILGDGVPKHIGGFANNFNYKRFRLHIFFQWSYGNDVYNANRLMLEENVGNRSHLNQYATYANRWSFDNQESLIPLNNGQSHYGVYSSRVLEDASYLRLKTMSLSYSVPPAYLGKIGLKSLSLSTNWQNILTWTKYSGMDPEVAVRSSALTPGFDYSAYPHARTITCRLIAGF